MIIGVTGGLIVRDVLLLTDIVMTIVTVSDMTKLSQTILLIITRRRWYAIDRLPDTVAVLKNTPKTSQFLEFLKSFGHFLATKNWFNECFLIL